jgi:hypothetical protein
MRKFLVSILTVAFLAAILSAGPAHAATYATKSWVSDYFMLKSSSYTRTQMDARYVKKADAYTKTQLDSRYVNVAGDTMTGNLTVGGDIEAASFAYPTAETRTIFLSPFAFHPVGDLTFMEPNLTDGVYKNPAGSSDYAKAPLFLPYGATISKMKVYYTENDDTEIAADIYRIAKACDEACASLLFLTVLAEAQCTAIEQPCYSVAESPCIDNCSIDNADYYYFISVNLLNTTEDYRFRGVEIEYTVDGPS